MAASALLRSSRLASGLSQSELATLSKTSQPNVSTIESGRRVPTVDTLERLLHRAGYRLVAIPHHGTDAIETADRISVALAAQSQDGALRAFLDYSDALQRATGLNRVTLAISEPPPTGLLAWDAALAGLVAFRLAEAGLPAPDWTTDSYRFLAEPATPQLSEYDLEPDISKVPAEFLRRNVLIERSTLESV